MLEMLTWSKNTPSSFREQVDHITYGLQERRHCYPTSRSSVKFNFVAKCRERVRRVKNSKYQSATRGHQKERKQHKWNPRCAESCFAKPLLDRATNFPPDQCHHRYVVHPDGQKDNVQHARVACKPRDLRKTRTIQGKRTFGAKKYIPTWVHRSQTEHTLRVGILNPAFERGGILYFVSSMSSRRSKGSEWP